MSNCNHDKCLRDGCVSCCYCGKEMTDEPRILVTRQLVEKAITVFGLGGSRVVLDGIMKILKDGQDV
jgi:hypothetical protein